jgi:peptidoglycan hydrolase-like protein with peptidoglycan-binding domain
MRIFPKLCMAGILAILMGCKSAMLVYQEATPETRLIDIQQNLITLGYLDGKADGVMGPKTKNAVIQFQKDNGISPDGEVSYSLYARAGLEVTEAAKPPVDDRPWHLVCFESKRIAKSLSLVIDPDQFLRMHYSYDDEKKINKNGCDFVHIPPGSTAKFVGFLQQRKQPNFYRENGFIFGIYEVTYSNSGQTMYAANSIYPDALWSVKKDSNCGPDWVGSCVLPKTCQIAAKMAVAADHGKTAKMEIQPDFGKVEAIVGEGCETSGEIF